MSTCKPIISVYRGLPVDPTDPTDKKYLSVQGQIINNVFNGSIYVPGTPTTTPPAVSLNVPLFKPDTSGLRPVTCDDERYGGFQQPPKCGPLSCSIGDCDENPLFTLPSLSFLLKNNLNCRIVKVDPCDFLNLGSESGLPFYVEQSNCLNSPISNSGCPAPNSTCTITSCEYNFTDCGVTTISKSPYYYDGLLAAVYTIGMFKSYSFLPSTKDVLELFICPYSAVNTTLNVSSKCNSDIIGTAPFCIGNESPCAYVNLLQFSSATCDQDPSCTDPSDPSDPSSDGQVFSQLVWVQVQLSTQNKYGHRCIKKPYSLHIEPSPHDPLSGCYEPRFATSRTCFINSGLDTSCNGGPYPTQCAAFKGCPYPVTGTTASHGGNTTGITGGVSVDIVFVNDCIEISELSSVPSCNVFIVLLPKVPTLL